MRSARRPAGVPLGGAAGAGARGPARFATADQVWAAAGAAEAFQQFGGGREGLERGLERCVAAGALVSLRLLGDGPPRELYFVNNPASRRAVARARAGELVLVPGAVAEAIERESRPGIFRLYEENVGTITPLVAERLLWAADNFPTESIEAAFREAAELNRRNWRYIERILTQVGAGGPLYETDRRAPAAGTATGRRARAGAARYR